MYAIVRSGGKQHKVSVGDELEVERGVGSVGATVRLPALLVVDGETVTSDPATLSGVRVTAKVLRELRGPKIDIGVYKNKTGYRRRLGHRQSYAVLEVTGIDGAPVTEASAEPAPPPEPVPAPEATAETTAAPEAAEGHDSGEA